MDINKDLELIIQLCKKNDLRAQSLVYNTYRAEIHYYVMSNYTTDNVTDIEEVVNMTFFKMFSKFELYAGIGSLGGWLKQIAKFSIYDHYRKRKKYLVESGAYLLSEGDFMDGDDVVDISTYTCFVSKEDHVATFCEKDYIDVIKNALTDREYEIFMLVYEGYKHREIAEKLSINENTCKWHVMNARTKLKQLIKR